MRMDALPPDGFQLEVVTRNRNRSPAVTLNVFAVSEQNFAPLAIEQVISVAA